MTASNDKSVTTITTPSDIEAVMSHVVSAPLALVYDAWTNPKHVPRWMLGPGGWTMTICETDLRPGGEWRFGWRKDDDGTEMAMKGVHREVQPPERLVSTESWGGDWPETLNEITFSEADSKTTIELRIHYPSKQARDAAMATGMKDGANATFHRFDEYLRTAVPNS